VILCEKKAYFVMLGACQYEEDPDSGKS